MKKIKNKYEKKETNMNFGPQVGLNGWGGPNIGNQLILRIRKLQNIVSQPNLRTYGPRNTKTNTKYYTYAYVYVYAYVYPYVYEFVLVFLGP